jgi:hypothetical protein
MPVGHRCRKSSTNGAIDTMVGTLSARTKTANQEKIPIACWTAESSGSSSHIAGSHARQAPVIWDAYYLPQTVHDRSDARKPGEWRYMHSGCRADADICANPTNYPANRGDLRL